MGHSLGGLISFVALNRRPDLVHSALFAGVPFGPIISFLEDMHAGTATGLNRRILSPHVLFTFVSRYSSFPLEPGESALKDQDGNFIPHDWYSGQDWERHKLGIFATLEQAKVSNEQRELTCLGIVDTPRGSIFCRYRRCVYERPRNFTSEKAV